MMLNDANNALIKIYDTVHNFVLTNEDFPYICTIIIALCIILILLYFSKNKSSYKHKFKCDDYINYQSSIEIQKKQWWTGDLPCDGWVCNKTHRCNEPERWFCRDVISKIVPNGHFLGQFYVPAGHFSKKIGINKRFLDFAIETSTGKRIDVELDGYKKHVTDLSRSDFDGQLLRQNELICAGWAILRFSFDQLWKDAEMCKNMIKLAMDDPMPHLPSAGEFNQIKIVHRTCQNCGGKAYRLLNRNGGFFWECEACNQKFNYTNN